MAAIRLWCSHSVGSRRSALTTLAVLIIFLPGCGRVPRSGVPRTNIVLRFMNGQQPQKLGQVDVCNLVTGEAAGGTLDQSGEVRLPGIAMGEYVVTILPPGPEGPEGKLPAGAESYRVAKKYSYPAKSPLKITVEKSSKDFLLTVNE